MSVEAKQAKQLVIDEIKERFDESSSVVVMDYLGLTVEEADALRKELREAGVQFTVYKNTLIKRAIDGTEYEGLSEYLKGSTALAFSHDDMTAGARVLKKAKKSYNKMEFKGGYVEGHVYDKKQIEAFADIPSREQLIARFMGSIQNPLAQFVRTLAAIAEEIPEGGTAADLIGRAPVAEEEIPAEA